jgi:hypothetical protein
MSSLDRSRRFTRGVLAAAVAALLLAAHMAPATAADRMDLAFLRVARTGDAIPGGTGGTFETFADGTFGVYSTRL